MTDITFTTKHVVKNPSSFLKYDFTNMMIYQSDIKLVGPNHFQVNYKNQRTDSNFDIVYTNNPKNNNVNYKIDALYLSKLVHKNIKTGTLDTTTGTPFIGELIIHAKNITDDTTLNLCFLIKNVNSKKDATDKEPNGSLTKLFDNIIKNGDGFATAGMDTGKTTTLNFSSDGTIPNQDLDGCIIYTNSDDSVYTVVYLKPIAISNTNLQNYIGSIGILPNTVVNIPQATENNNVISAMTAQLAQSLNPSDNPNFKADQNIYIDCNPTGESVDRLTTYNLPISSDLMKDIDKSSFAKLCGNFAAVGLLALVCYIGVPVLYNAAVVKKMDDDDKLLSKFFITAFLIIIAIALYSSGQDMGSMESLMAGLLVTSVAIITYILISNEEQKNNLASAGLDPMQLFIFTGGVFGFLIKKCMPLIIPLWAVLLIIVLCIRYLAKKKDENGEDVPLIDDKKMGVILGWFIVVVIPALSGLLVQVAE